MQVYDIIEQAQGGQAMANLAVVFGIAEEQVRSAAQFIVPELAWSLERNTLSRGGLADLLNALGQGHHEQILDMPRAWTDPRVATDGKQILAHILGSEHKLRALAARAAQASGLGEGIIQMLLPILAQMLMGAIARYAKGGLGDILSRLPIPGGGGSGQGRPQPQPMPSERGGGGFPGGGGFELPRSELPPAGGFPMPPLPPSGEAGRYPEPQGAEQRRGGFEMPWPQREIGPPREPGPQRETGPQSERDQPDQSSAEPDFRTGGGIGLPRVELPPAGGYPMPPMPPSPDGSGADVGGRGGGVGLPFPLPGPGGTNPYGDLSDILRRGGSTTGEAGGGGLWRIVRGLLGSALGFGGRGIFGWLVQLIVMRWGWRFLQRILFGR